MRIGVISILKYGRKNAHGTTCATDVSSALVRGKFILQIRVRREFLGDHVLSWICLRLWFFYVFIAATLMRTRNPSSSSTASFGRDFWISIWHIDLLFRCPQETETNLQEMETKSYSRYHKVCETGTALLSMFLLLLLRNASRPTDSNIWLTGIVCAKLPRVHRKYSGSWFSRSLLRARTSCRNDHDLLVGFNLAVRGRSYT